MWAQPPNERTSMAETDDVIAALRAEHDSLAAVVSSLVDGDLAVRSGASEWDVSQVLSHLGSGAELNLATLQQALGESADGEPAESVWARWNAMGRQERAEGYLRADETLVARFEALTAAERDELMIDLGFLPAPVPVAVAGRMRLSEAMLHAWDVRVAFDDSAVLGGQAVAAVLHQEPDLIGWTAKTDALNGRPADVRVTTTDPDSTFTLRLGDCVEVVQDGGSAGSDATLELPAEAWLRLVAGRLSPEHTPEGVRATGAVDLELLRQVFPGY